MTSLSRRSFLKGASASAGALAISNITALPAWAEEKQQAQY